MEQTVVGLFDDRDDAQDAMAELVEEGFTQENIDISGRGMTSGSESDDSTDTSIGDRISNFFNSLFGDDESTARSYSYAAEDAEAILTVQADSPQRAELARDIMDRNGAIDVDNESARGTSQFNAGAVDNNTTETTIPVVEESLDVGKREVERGGARIRSRIIERPVEEHIRLREEHVTINRRPVDREVTAEDMSRFQPGEMEITERAEVPIVGKEARVVEEVEVGKQVTEHDETVRDTVRGMQVNVEEFDATTDTTNTKARGAKP